MTESTKYWHLGPVDLYNELKKMIIRNRTTSSKNGRIFWDIRDIENN